jgi:hypothetical protein
MAEAKLPSKAVQLTYGEALSLLAAGVMTLRRLPAGEPDADLVSAMDKLDKAYLALARQVLGARADGC